LTSSGTLHATANRADMLLVAASSVQTLRSSYFFFAVAVDAFWEEHSAALACATDLFNNL
jgi:hypothetical protein